MCVCVCSGLVKGSPEAVAHPNDDLYKGEHAR